MTRCVILLLVASAGCQSFRLPAAGSRPSSIHQLIQPTAIEPAKETTESRPPIAESRQPKAQSPGPPAKPAPDPEEHLNRAVALLEKGADGEALPYLERYVAERPDQLVARANLGELLFRQKKFNDSRLHFELFIGLAQEQGDAAFRYLIHCHSRLVEIAEEQADAFGEHLNRGIGLYLLACKRASEPDPDGDCSVDSLLCRAAGELREARREQPDESRTHFYLYEVYSRLGQHAAAREALAAADSHALLSRLTPLERRQLQMACLREAERLPGR